MVTPAVKREAVAHLKTNHEMSERRACRVIGCQRMTVRYRSRRPDDPALRERLRGPGPGTPAVRLPPAADLPAPGGLCGEPQAAVPHLRRGTAAWCANGVAAKEPWEQAAPDGGSGGCPNDRWSLDFVSDQLACGRRFRILAIFDDCTRECLARSPTPRSPAGRVARELDR